MPEPGSFGALLRQDRAAAGLSQEKLAKQAGLSRGGIADLERDARRTPFSSTVRRLAEALHLSPDQRAALLAAARPVNLGTPGPGTTAPVRLPLPVPSTSFVERARQLGDLLRTRLERLRERFALVGEVRGLGPMLALELVRDRGTKEPATAETAVVLAACHRRGLIVNRAGLYDNVVRLLPAFVISDADVEQGLDILEAALAEVSEAFSSSNLSTQGDRNHAR